MLISSSYYSPFHTVLCVVARWLLWGLLLTDAPPSPNAPSFPGVGSTWVTLSWTELSCDGGHNITELVIRYKEESEDIITSFNYIYNLDPSLRNYTVHNLEPDTPYTFAVQALSAEFLSSSFSDNNTVNTLVAGMWSVCTCVVCGVLMEGWPCSSLCSQRCPGQACADTSCGGVMEGTSLS